MKYYLVYCCGCTDCFPFAIYRSKKGANNYVKKHCKNPEGSMIREFDDIYELAKEITKCG